MDVFWFLILLIERLLIRLSSGEISSCLRQILVQKTTFTLSFLVTNVTWKTEKFPKKKPKSFSNRNMDFLTLKSVPKMVRISKKLLSTAFPNFINIINNKTFTLSHQLEYLWPSRIRSSPMDAVDIRILKLTIKKQGDLSDDNILRKIKNL
jgi:hypothetical protein